VSLRSRRLLLFFVALATAPLFATEVSWPTSMDRTVLRDPEDFLQPTISGKPESALFGMVREEGKRFHEGIDIKPVAVNPTGEPLDLVLAAMDGQVAYINPHVNGPYGKYVVLVHPDAELAVYTLYAHLAKIEPTLKVGAGIRRGTPIALMGHTSAGVSAITKDRAHLHFEVGLLLSTGFNNWYATQPENRKSPNQHSLWNGQNLIGMDPLLVLGAKNPNLLAAVRRQPVALSVVMHTAKTPDFVKRYPMLSRGDAARTSHWYVEFSWQGMPLRWTALETTDPALPVGRWRLMELDQAQRAQLIQRKMLAPDGRSAGELLQQNVEILLSTAR
jgi:hypothetical protein